MSELEDDDFIEKLFTIIDKWSFDMCVFCDNASLITLDGMVDYKCEKCKKKMSDGVYLGEIAKLVYKYREKKGFSK